MQLSVFDLDETLLRVNCSFRYYAHLRTLKLFPTPSIFSSAFYLLKYKLFELSPLELHKKVFDKFLKGKDKKKLEKEVSNFWDKHLDSFYYQPAIDRLKVSINRNDYTIILSNSPDFLVEPIAKRFAVSEYKATKYSYDDNGFLTGIEVIMDGTAKANYIKKIKQDLNIKIAHAYSDSIWDLPMLEVVENPVAVNPDKKLRSIAQKRNWKII